MRKLLSTTACLLALAGCSSGSSEADSQANTERSTASHSASSRPDNQVDTERSTASPTDTGRSAPAEDVGQYEQTWTLSYDKMTCAQWLGQMDAHQQYVAGADMLLGAARTKASNVGLPPDSYVRRFTQQLTTACTAEGTMTITDAGVALVMTDPTLYDY
jgi:hypothetical protein